MPAIEIAAFYHFARLPDAANLRAPLQAHCDLHGARGIVLVAPEGVNGTIAAAPERMAELLAGIAELAGLTSLPHKTSFAEEMPFLRMKVRVKREIVTLGAPADPLARVGTYVEPQDWGALIDDPEVLLIDVRNDYEVALGTFRTAIDPQTTSFSQFPDFARKNLDPARHRKVAMFCTGGIRCEKASSYLLAQGFEEVFHLKGGILKYLEEQPEDGLWQGACFVFDGRVAVGHGLAPAGIALCHGCRAPLQPADKADQRFEPGVSCPRCHAELSEAQKASARERERQVNLAKARGRRHLGPLEG